MSNSVGQRAFQNARLKKKQQAETAKLLERAVALVNTGALPDARAVLQQLLQLSPRHFDALHLLGMTEYHTRRYHEAEQHLAQAVDAEPRSVDAHFNRGVVLSLLGRHAEARTSYQRTIALKPQHALALFKLAYTCGVLELRDEALQNYDRAVAVKKDFAEAWYNRGVVLEQLQRYHDALDSHDRALAIKPRYAEALNGRGSALAELGRFGEALQSYDEALAINPGLAEALNKRGIALFDLERNDDALESYDRAIAADPRMADAHNNRAIVLHELKRYDEALDSYDRALAIDPAFAPALSGRGAVQSSMRDFTRALESFARAIEIQPGYAEAFANRGGTLHELNRLPEALASLDRAVSLNPGLFKAWLLRGSVLLASRRTAEAMACGEKALALKPDSPTALTLLGNCHAALGDVEGAVAKFDQALAIRPDCYEAIVSKIFVLDFSDNAGFEQHRDVRRLWWQHIGSALPAPSRSYRNVLDPQRRLVVGYVSSDFRNHSAAKVFKPVLQYVDKAQFETVCYSCSTATDDATKQFQQLADRWRDASQWSDDRLAEQIRQDEIDILVDLSGYTDGDRLRVIAAKPAPIVAHGWGHCTPPGLPTIDYVFADPVTIPPDVRHLYLETIYDLPCMLSLEELPAEVTRTALPALSAGFVTFGIFNRISKISDSAAQAWAQILDRVPDSRLLIKDGALDDPSVRASLLARLARYGVSADRVELRGGTPRLQHLAAFNDVDICLDPFPQNGGASTWEALRMRIPVVAKLGNALSQRAAGGILTAAGLADWVAQSTDGYVDIAVEHAGRLDELAKLREDLPRRLEASAAGNPRLYGEAVGNAYRAMWKTYCAREAPTTPA